MSELQVEVNDSPIHGKGLFAATSISKGTYIGQYDGPETTDDSTYVLWIGDAGEEVGILGENELKYLNHTAKPNAEFDGVELYAIKRIPKGKEITIHYGEEWEGI